MDICAPQLSEDIRDELMHWTDAHTALSILHRGDALARLYLFILGRKKPYMSPAKRVASCSCGTSSASRAYAETARAGRLTQR